MFAIIITEKGGTERREVFDKTEISVGRVQGNELMLPKGNVSKHHARLLYRDGRFIVTDLKSTNGTYVNGRKITQATIVREGDKIYVGDFILRLEVPQQAHLPPAAHEPSISQLPQGEPTADRPSGQGPVSHYPLENDPDEAAAAAPVAAPVAPAPPLRMPAPPRLPSQTRDFGSAPSAPVRAPIASDTGGMAQAGPPGPTHTSGAHPPPVPVGPTHSSGVHVQPAGPSTGSGVHASPVAAAPVAIATPSTSAQPPPLQPMRKPGTIPSARPSAPRHATPLPMAAIEVPRVPAHRLAVATLAARIEEMLDLSSLEYGAPPQEPLASQLEQVIREEAPKLKASGQIPAEVDLENLARDAREELAGLGPIEPLMRDDDVLEIHIQSHANVLTTRASGGRRAELPFATEATCRRIVRRMCWQGGVALQGDETVLERMLYGGVQVLAIFNQVAPAGTIATFRKRAAAPQSLEDAVRNGSLSRAMATFLGQVVAGRRNIAVAGPSGSGVGSFVGALAAGLQPGERALLVHELGSPIVPIAHAALMVVSSPDRVRDVFGAASRLRPDRLIAPSIGADAAGPLLDAIAGGTDGVIAGLRAPTLRQAVGRLAGEYAASRGAPSLDGACELVGSCFDILVEFTRLRDGRSRVLRIAEPAGVESGTLALRDLFAFSVERTATGGAIEGSFHASGAMPRVAEELTARGVSIEPGLFRR